MLIYLGKLYLPISIWAFPLWIFYAAVTGTVATGLCKKQIMLYN
jgi:hypothetical protein